MDLKSKYLSATKVIHRHVGTRKQLVPKELNVRPVRESELVYLVSSPDYCTHNEKHGSLGTQNRYDFVSLNLTVEIVRLKLILSPIHMFELYSEVY